MKKYILLVWLLLNTTVARAQGRWGLKFSPSIAFSKVHTDPNSTSFVSKELDLWGKGKGGVIYDHAFQDNHYISTGLLYSVQQFAIEDEGPSPKVQEAHELRYAQVPLLLKFYTSEIALDTRFYGVVGAIGQLKVDERNTKCKKNQLKPFFNTFRHFGLAGLMGAGAEYDIGLSTSFFVGISYQWGLRNIIKEANDAKVMGYSNLVSVDVGIRF
ncbi:MAG: outer membrane beta-barrel protein [Bacteroidota bacterium]